MPVFLYTIAVQFYTFFIHIAAFFNPKAKLWVTGRKDIWTRLSHAFSSNPMPIVWMHCASLGEFEQGRPVLEKIRQTQPQYKILLTFFSPSGYEIRKNYEGADWVFYLPADSPKNAQKFLNIVQPQLAIFVKYEFWYHYLYTLQQGKVKTILISAHFRPNQVFFKWYGGIFRLMLSYFEHIFVQNEASKQLLNPFELSSIIIAGDTRLDRVLAIKNTAKTFPKIEEFCQNAPILVCGSTWSEDEAILIPLIQKELLPKGWKIIIAPHLIDTKHLQEFEKQLNTFNYSKYSDLNTDADILIINNIGMLSSLYRYATIAYIGGGFGAGIHNTLEAAAYEIPVFFGPKHKKFAEAVELKNLGIGISISDSDNLIQQFKTVNTPKQLTQIREQAQAYIQNNKGATDTILNTLEL